METVRPDGRSALDAQYSPHRILLVWLLATAPMGLLAWVVWPALKGHVALHAGVLFWLLMIAGMIWQFVLSLILVRQELGTLHWSTVAPRIWAQQPRDPQTGEKRPSLWWMLVPITAAFLAITYGCELAAPVFGALGWGPPAGTDIRELADPVFAGQWWLLAIAVVSSAFNYVLGEELLFRGVLLPRMAGVFGRWDWLANNVLFSLYHMHKIWDLPAIFLTSLPFSWSARRYRTIWFSIVLHALEGVVLLVLVFGVVSGMAV
ncbi:MAG: CPBP family intramembrane metalloprotease [Gordonia sp. (in: high G+C Gram-positive bacteria)]